MKLIKALLNQSLIKESYDITLITLIKFQNDLDDREISSFLYVLENKLKNEF